MALSDTPFFSSCCIGSQKCKWVDAGTPWGPRRTWQFRRRLQNEQTSEAKFTQTAIRILKMPETPLRYCTLIVWNKNHTGTVIDFRWFSILSVQRIGTCRHIGLCKCAGFQPWDWSSEPKSLRMSTCEPIWEYPAMQSESTSARSSDPEQWALPAQGNIHVVACTWYVVWLSCENVSASLQKQSLFFSFSILQRSTTGSVKQGSSSWDFPGTESSRCLLLSRVPRNKSSLYQLRSTFSKSFKPTKLCLH